MFVNFCQLNKKNSNHIKEKSEHEQYRGFDELQTTKLIFF